jgi:uncharacterized membrane protein YqjE
MATSLDSKRPTTKALVPTAAPAPSTATLVREAMTDAVEVVQAHFELAVLEVREDARAAAKVAAGLALGSALALLALAFFGIAGALALALVLPAWAAYLIVGGVVALAAAVVLGKAWRRLSTHDFTPERTMEALQHQLRAPRP